jgi:hypothetical protein
MNPLRGQAIEAATNARKHRLRKLPLNLLDSSRPAN